MTEEQQNESLNAENNDHQSYHQFGFLSAQNSNSNPQTIESFLDGVYERFLSEQKLDEEGLRRRISRLRSEVQQKRGRKNEITAEIESNKKYKIDKDQEIEELELERIDIKTNGETEHSGTIPFVIGAFITILLTFYLFVFYSSSGYSAFYGVKAGSLGFINSNVFTDAANKGSGVIALIILFPVIFLGLGFLIHDALEKIKKAKRVLDKMKHILLILALLLITLTADAFIGYKISQGIHINNFNAGMTDKFWEFSMIYADINFYLVLILGFVVYVIWGFLLNFVLSHPYLKSESERMILQLENIDNKITEKKRELSEIVNKINILMSTVTNLDNEITDQEKDIVGYENGVIPVNIPLFRASVGEFMGGYQTYTNNAFPLITATQLINEATQRQERWLITKIQNLSSENNGN
jgi:cell division septum initiation protein DivIVA